MSQLHMPLTLKTRLMAIVLGAGVLLAGSLASSAVTTADSGDDSASAVPVSAPISETRGTPTPTDPSSRPEVLPPHPEPNLPPGDVSIQSHQNCPDGTACMWHYAHFEGRKEFAYPWMDASGWLGYEGYNFNSAKNRFGNRKFLTGNFYRVTSCINPGGERVNLDYSDRFNVGPSGSRC